MTVSSTTTKNSYSGDASTTTFAYGFKIFAAVDLTVILRSATGTETVQTLTTHYSVTNAGVDTGGNVVFETAPASGVTVVIRRNVAQTQTTDYTANDPFPAESHEDALDRLTFIAQQQQEELDRSFKVSRTNTITSAEFTEAAADRALKSLGFDSSGDLTTIADFLPAGGDSAQFTYSTTTTDADPGSGFIRFNHATLSSATIAYVDDAEINGTDVSAWVQSFDDVSGNDTNRGRIRMSKSNTLDTWAVWKVSGAATDASGYTKLVLTYIDGAGAFANTDKVFISFVASGEDGAIPGYFYKFATSTTDGDPGAGVLRFNNATYANVTEIYIDDADSNGGATQADTATWGASTSTIKGYLHIVDINDSSTYARFKITAAVDDETGYNKITVVHLASNNTFSADDELSVHFTSVGLKGDTGPTGSTGSTGATGDVSLAGTETLTNKTLTAPKINEDVALTSTATELNKLDALSRGSILYGNASAATAVLTKGTANQVLTSDGTDISWADAGGTAWQSVITGATVTAVAGRGYPINTTSQACTVTLPSSASVGDTISIVDYAGTFATNEVILTSSLKIQGQTANAHLTTNREGVTLTYVDATQGWASTSGVNSGTQSIDYLSYPADFLVVAGGGAGGAQHSGGGGAGGYRNSYASEASGGGASSETSLTLVPETVYTVTIGAGGAEKAAGSTNNNVGANSLISGSGITTITSVGGGGGASWGQVGTAGGSGGGDGGSVISSALAGTANQGFAGGVLTEASQHGGGGGGGASAVGSNSSGSGSSTGQAGNGGAGLTSVINGSTGRGGGGGGGTYGPTLNVATGSHGGGNGGLNGSASGTVVQPVAGTANTGGGGGGSQKDSVNGAAGGSGVVILRMGTVFYSGTTSGSPTVSTSGTDTILTFNGSGSYTG